MVGPLGLGISQRPPHGVRFEQHVGVGKEQPVPGRLVRRSPHGVCFSQPAGGQFAVMNHAQATWTIGMRRHPLHDFAGAIGRAIVDCDYFVVGVVERKQLR